jgi:prevent-host-death family protein
MGKTIGAAEFKTHALRLLDEVAQTGEPITITKRGRVVAVVNPPEPPLKREFSFGFLKNPGYRPDPTPDEPAYDKPWNAELGLFGNEDEEDEASAAE